LDLSLLSHSRSNRKRMRLGHGMSCIESLFRFRLILMKGGGE
jgi:hypothetical protein